MFTSYIIALAPMIALYGFQASVNIVVGDMSIAFPGSDSVMHFVGGVVTAWTGLLLYRLIRKTSPLTIAPFALFAAALIFFTATVGIAWEWYEFLHDRYFSTVMQPTLSDTMKDLALDLMGASLFAVALAYRVRDKKLKPAEY